VGLTASAGVAGWIEFALLRRGITRLVGKADVPAGLLARLWAAALGAGAVGVAVRFLLASLPPSRLAAIAKAAAVFGSFGAVYLLLALAFGVPESRAALARAQRLLRR
jgi:putative peptidoglycan lipid II flippase